MLHVNDSKTPFGSRVDRHEKSEKEKSDGSIGTHPAAPALSPKRVAGRAFLLETPIDLPGDDRRNVAAIWKLVGVDASQEPDAEDGFSMTARKTRKKKGRNKGRPKGDLRLTAKK